MRFALQAHSGDWDDGPTLAIVAIDGNQRREFARRHKMFEALKAYDEGLAFLEFWDNSPNWYEPIDIEKYGLEEIETVPVLEVARIKIDEEPISAECSRAVVDERGIHWVAYPKHGCSRMDTECIPWRMLEE